MDTVPKPLHPYELMLQESTQHFLSELQKLQPDFSGLSSIFARLVQTMQDPPLEIVWFYSAVTFRCGGFVAKEPLARVSAVKDLFQVLVSCSASCSGVKRIAVLAPVIPKLLELVNDENLLWVRKDIHGFVEGIISYICLCCCQDLGRECDSAHLMSCFSDLVRVWTVEGGVEHWDYGEALKAFFPLLSNKVCQKVGVGHDMSFLAGVVMTEALLLNLCLKLGPGGSSVDLHKDMLNWAINSINVFQNWYFFDIIFRTLLDPILPITFLLNLEDEVLARKVLYDAIIMVDYSFLDRQCGIQIPFDVLKDLAITWLFVAEDAVQFTRKHGDRTKAISYTDAFTQCHLCCQLVDWISNQTGIARKRIQPVVSTPGDLIRLLLILEAQGVRLVNHISKVHSKAVTYKSRVIQELEMVKPDSKNMDENLFFFTGNEGRREQAEVTVDQAMGSESVDAVFLDTANLAGSGGRRKRGEEDRIEGETQAKFFKYHFEEKQLPSCDEDDSSSLNDTETFAFDEGVEDMDL